MEVLPFKLPKSEKDALIHQEDTGIAFFEQLHQHEEIQISYIVKGSGTLIVGDSVSVFNENDILVIGENLPHVFEVANKLLIKVGRREKPLFLFT